MKQIRLHAFEMACVGHIQQGLWRHPRDGAVNYARLDQWVALARTLERGLFDGLFLADVLGVYDVYGGSPDAAIRGAVQVPNLDPMLLVPTMAYATRHLGFAVTANVGAEDPFIFARRMSTLDHLTGGRIGWNIVTGYLDSGARALGQMRQADHDSRYDAADEFLLTVRSLWEDCWDRDAVLRDRSTGVYADPARVRAVQHGSRRGVHLCEPSPQRTPVLYQAGSSARGRRFAAEHAECVFVNGSSTARVAELVAQLRADAAALGRRLLVFMGVTVVVAETDALARQKFADYDSYASAEGALVQSAGSLGVDFAALEEDEPIRMGPTNAVISNLEAATSGPVMTKQRFRDAMSLGGRQVPVVGSPSQVADVLVGWVEEADLDGFVVARTVTPECFVDFVDLVVPELQRRDAFKTSYADGPLRHKLLAQ